LPKRFVEEVTTDMADVDVSGCEILDALAEDKVPEADLTLVPFSDPLADAPELGTPPALAELSE
jgi:hypothetical protein